MKHPPLKATGFTLVELQIALLILVLIGAVLMGGLQLSAKSNKVADKLNSANSDLRVISKFLNQQITGIMPLTTLHNNKSSLMFKGQHNSIYYVGNLPKHVVTGGPWLIHLYVRDKQLRLEYKVFDNRLAFSKNLSAEFESLILLENVDQFSLFYQKASTSLWQATWQERHIMPAKIKIKINHHKHLWPELIISVHSYAGVTTPFNVLKIQ